MYLMINIIKYISTWFGSHFKKVYEIVDQSANKCDIMEGNHYKRRHSEVVICIHLTLMIKYDIITP